MSETESARSTSSGASDMDTAQPADHRADPAAGPAVGAAGGAGTTSATAPDAAADSPDLSPTSTVGPPATTALPDPIPHAGLRYAALRLLMLGAVGGVLYVIGLREWLLAIAAVLVSGIVSLFLFMSQRNDAAVNLEHTVDHWKHRNEHETAVPE